jgi:putative transposase
MSELPPDRRSIRLKSYDYSLPGAYFVTMCTEKRKCTLGEIVDRKFEPSRAGRIVKESWFELPYHYAGLELDAFVVMPNHVHAVIILQDPFLPAVLRSPIHTVGAGLKPAPSPHRRRTLSEVVRAFKTFSARHINKAQRTPGRAFWQRGYFEQIVKGEKALFEIRGYIANNPGNWDADTDNPLFATQMPKQP